MILFAGSANADVVPLDSLVNIPVDAITNKDKDLIIEPCRQYPGFINKIVQCTTHMSTRESVISGLNRLNKKFSAAGVAFLILYICLFGLKLSFNALENARSEIMITIITCFFITYVLNTARMEKFLYFFTGLQGEFAAVATAAVYTKQTYDLEDAKAKGKDTSSQSRFICYGPLDSNNEYQSATSNKNNMYTPWQRADCMFAYLIGANPVLQRVGSYFDQGGSGSPDKPDPSQPFSNYNSKTDYDVWASKTNPFVQMAEDPYCFFSYAGLEENLNFSDGNVVQKLWNDAQAAQDYCILKLIKKNDDGSFSIGSIDKLQRIIKNDRQNLVIVFSTAAIIIGLLFQDQSVGLILVITGFITFFLMFIAFAQAALIYITSYFAVLVLGMFAPLIIPCFLFKYTRTRIFDKWIQLLFAYTIQPGLVLCYLTFMLSVIQFISTYGTQNAQKSFMDLTLGDAYKNGDQEDKPIISVITKTTSGSPEDAGLGQNIAGKLQSSSIPVSNNANLYYNTSTYYNIGSNSSAIFQAPATEKVSNGQAGLFDLDAQSPGANMFNIKMPSFEFFSKDFANPYGGDGSKIKAGIRSFLNTDLSNPNVGNSLNEANKDKNLTEEQIKLNADYNKTQYQMKLGYIQYLIILFIAMAICFSFLRNVMHFGAQLAGVSVRPIGGLSNVYDTVANKITRSLAG